MSRRKDAEAAGPLLSVDALRVSFGGGRDRAEVVRGVGFTLDRGDCLAIVGESGSGKSVTARALLGLAGRGSTVTGGIELDGEDLTAIDDRRWRRIRGGRIGMVLQDALSSLDPVRTVGAEVTEAIGNHRTLPRAERPARVVSLLERTSVPDPGLRARQYPHELSGGLRQRALIASAIAADPDLIIADEPTTALDVTVAAEILDLLDGLRRRGVALLLISHDLAVVARMADRIAVMHRGSFVEHGPTERVLRSPAHPYTRRLLGAVPTAGRRNAPLMPPEPAKSGPAPESGCRYAHRCALAVDLCRAEDPAPVLLTAEHRSWCHRTGDREPARPAAPSARRAPAAEPRTLIEVDGVAKSYPGPDRTRRPAVEDVSLTLREGETLGVVGESGSGKTTLAGIILGLVRPDRGSVRFLDRPWSPAPESARRPLRDRIRFVQQDPMASFDPRYTVERVVAEAVGASGALAARGRRDTVVALLERVGLDAGFLRRHPVRLSGGQRQRVAIARALASEPDVIVCDEPVSALDVSVQAQILDLFAELRDDLGMALLFISHDLGVVHHLSDRVLVMREARVVESGPVDQVFNAPRAPYTRRLLSALPALAVPEPAADQPVDHTL
ncbi:ABC transporter ATP-binding protein [Spirillospora sp. NPDC048832]